MALKSINKDLVNFLRVQRTHQMSIFALCSFLTVQDRRCDGVSSKHMIKRMLLKSVI